MDPKTLRDRVRARLPQAGRWYDIRALEDGKAVVRIYEEISLWGVTADDFARDIAQISAGEIEVQINSPGGDVFDGLAIYNALRTHPAHVTTRVDGIAASAASVIVQAGDRRVMVESAQLMIHEAWGLAIGPARELREFADLLDKQNDVIAAIYAARSDRDTAHFRELMSTDTYLTDAEAVELGLADEVYVPPRKEGGKSRGLADELRAALTDEDLRREYGLPPLAPSAGEREEDAPALAPVTSGQAEHLLDALTFRTDKEE